MQIPDSLSIWLKELSIPLGVLLILGLVAYLIVKISASRRRVVLSRQRADVTEETFVEDLARYNFDPLITGTTYRYLQEVQGIQFPILASDALDEDLGLDHDDLEQTISDLLNSLRREHQPGLRYEPVVTVEDLVRHLQASPRKDRQAAA